LVVRINQRITVADIKPVVINIMQKHIYSAKVVCCDVDFLPKETLANIFFT